MIHSSTCNNIKKKGEIVMLLVRNKIAKTINYILFRKSKNSDKIKALHINNYNNMKIKYKWLMHLGPLDKAKF